MAAQLEKIMDSKAVRRSLIRWILYMARGTEWEGEAHEALRRYMRGEYAVAGVLIRDAAPQEADLASAFSRIRKRAAAGALLALYALYLPASVEQAGDLVRSDG